jgi:nucleoside-diphosphate-sugar epimerase
MMGKSSILAKIDADIANRNEGGSSEICVRISSAGEDPLPSLVEAMAKILGSAGRQFVQEETRLRAKIIRGRGRKAAPTRASKIVNWRLESEEGGVCQRPMS